MQSFNEFMGEKRLVSRWTVLAIMVAGCFCGAVLTLVLVFAGLVG